MLSSPLKTFPGFLVFLYHTPPLFRTQAIAYTRGKKNSGPYLTDWGGKHDANKIKKWLRKKLRKNERGDETLFRVTDLTLSKPKVQGPVVTELRVRCNGFRSTGAPQCWLSSLLSSTIRSLVPPSIIVRRIVGAGGRCHFIQYLHHHTLGVDDPSDDLVPSLVFLGCVHHIHQGRMMLPWSR